MPPRTRRSRTTQATLMEDENQVRLVGAPSTSAPSPVTAPVQGVEARATHDPFGGDGKRTMKKARRTAASYYPGRDESLDAALGVKNPTSNLSQDEEDYHVESEDDWFELDMVNSEVTRTGKQPGPSKFTEAMVIERPSWDDEDNVPSIPGTVDVSDAGMNSSSASSAVGTDQGPVQLASPSVLHGQESFNGPIGSYYGLSPATLTQESLSAMTSGATTSSGPLLWPVDTDIIFASGTNRMALTGQRPLVRLVIQDAIEILRASLVLVNAFPDADLTISLVKDALLSAVDQYLPATSCMHARLEKDEQYFTKILPVPCTRLSIFRSKIKECCSAAIMKWIMSAGSPSEVIRLIQKQLSNYNYTFPTASNNNGLLMRSHPYRNKYIIHVIREVYFCGGSASIATRFNNQFPAWQGPDGTIKAEVPVPMVALVATALYAALRDWRTGKLQVTDFSANTYLDVYQGHVNTFSHIRINRNAAFHVMMTDIYSQASDTSGSPQLKSSAASGVSIAALDLDQLEQ
ncbi:hypothetical protein BJV78DRAFT_1151819 [Lactifluus subvellereus]|nr:hypothetical protein BJV78DRAFT_1151819 [Lactifluus subvellereus]